MLASGTTSHPSDPDPRLPHDLERTIFEISALSRPSLIPNLMLVAHRVRAWVEPLMYRVVFLDDKPPLDGLPCLTWAVFMRLLATKPPDFFAHSVRHLCLGDAEESGYSRAAHEKDVPSILRACSGITNLCDFYERHVSELECFTSLRSLTVGIHDLFSGSPTISFSAPVFRNITHLEILYDPVAADLVSILQLPRLTHFAFNNEDLSAELASTILPTCSTLRCIVFVARPGMLFRDLEPLLEDKRFAPIVPRDCRLDWQRGASGGVDYWTRAEKFVAARQAGEIQDVTHFILDEDSEWY